MHLNEYLIENISAIVFFLFLGHVLLNDDRLFNLQEAAIKKMRPNKSKEFFA